MHLPLTLPCSCKYLTNSIFHATASALREFLTGCEDSCNGPTLNTERRPVIFSSNIMKFSICEEQSGGCGPELSSCLQVVCMSCCHRKSYSRSDCKHSSIWGDTPAEERDVSNYVSLCTSASTFSSLCDTLMEQLYRSFCLHYIVQWLTSVRSRPVYHLMEDRGHRHGNTREI